MFVEGKYPRNRFALEERDVFDRKSALRSAGAKSFPENQGYKHLAALRPRASARLFRFSLLLIPHPSSLILIPHPSSLIPHHSLIDPCLRGPPLATHRHQ